MALPVPTLCKTKKLIFAVSIFDKFIVFTTPFEGSEGVLKDLYAVNLPFFSLNKIKSVKVPPMSIASLVII